MGSDAVGDGMLARGARISEVNIEVADDDGGISQEAQECCIEEGEIVKVGWAEEHSDNGCAACALYQNTSDNVRAVRYYGFEVPVGGITMDQGDAALASIEGAGAVDMVSLCFVGPVIMVDFGFSEEHDIHVGEGHGSACQLKVAVAARSDVISA